MASCSGKLPPPRGRLIPAPLDKITALMSCSSRSCLRVKSGRNVGRALGAVALGRYPLLGGEVPDAQGLQVLLPAVRQVLEQLLVADAQVLVDVGVKDRDP